MWLRISLVVVLVSALVGCANLASRHAFSSEAELLERRGTPGRVWANDDGTRTFEYATQPMGHQTWMYTINGEGRVVAQIDALARENLFRVREGMTLEEVQRLLGRHREITRYALSGEEVWDWNVANEWPDLIATYYNVHFVDGRVRRTSFTYEYPRNGDSTRSE